MGQQGWGQTQGADRPACRKQEARGAGVRHQGAGAQGSALSKALNQARAGRLQPTLHPQRPGSRQVRGLLWILSPAPEGVRSRREQSGARAHRPSGVELGGNPGQTPSPGKQAEPEEPRHSPGPPGLAQEVWGCPGQVSAQGRTGSPRQWPSRPRLPRQGRRSE